MQQKELVLIRPIYGDNVYAKGPRRLTCQTSIGGQYFVLTESWKMMTLFEFASLPPSSGERIMEIPFTSTMKEFRIEFFLKDPERKYPIEVDKKLSPEQQGDMARKILEETNIIAANRWKRDAVFNFFGRHQQIRQCQPFGNDHTPSSEEFEIDFISQKGRILNLIDRKRIKVASMINEMPARELKNVVMLYAPHLHARRVGEMRNGLAGLRGIALKPGESSAEPCGVLLNEPLMSEFLDNYKNDQSTLLKIYVNKGIQYKVIDKTTKGYTIHNGGSNIGNDVSAAVNYFSINQDEFVNYLQPEVDRLDEVPIDDTAEWDIPNVASIIFNKQKGKTRYEDEKAQSKAITAAILEEAKRLGIKYPNRYSEEELQAEIIRVGGVKDKDKVHG